MSYRRPTQNGGVAWIAIYSRRLLRHTSEFVKVVIHPGEIETWARHEGREVNEQTRSDYTHLLRRRENERRHARG